MRRYIASIRSPRDLGTIRAVIAAVLYSGINNDHTLGTEDGGRSLTRV